MYDKEKSAMIKEQLINRGIRDERVLRAMRDVPRENFVEGNNRYLAYADMPLSIGYGQTISQPYIVAYMLECLDIKEGDRVLEIGAGSGYEAALLSRLAREVVTMEIVEELYTEVKDRLEGLGYENIEVIKGDGYRGFEEKAPYDKIILSAAPNEIPKKLVEQLGIGGKMIAPVGSFFQELILIEKGKEGKVTVERLLSVRFVPMVKE